MTGATSGTGTATQPEHLSSPPVLVGFGAIVFNATFNNISAKIVAISLFFDGGNRRKPPTCRKSLTTFIT